MYKRHQISKVVEAEMEVDPSSTGGADSTAPKVLTTDDIRGYVPPRKAGASLVRIFKNKHYKFKLSMTPKGVHVTMNIITFLHKLQYNNHDILSYPKCTVETFEKKS